MRDWSLGPGDPLALTLAADFRLSVPDYADDHIWELELGSGSPPALSLHTTYGLRARLMRIFPRFTLDGQTITDPAAFATPPAVRRFYPNFILLNFSPFSGIDVRAEYWIPTSQTASGRWTVTNHSTESLSLLLELCGQLVPLKGQSLTLASIQAANVLAGRCEDLAPVIFLTGGPQPGPGPYSSLAIDLDLAPGSARTLTWAEAALHDQQSSFDLARRTVSRPWDAERARIELLNMAQTVEIRTGDPDWDAAFAFSQKTAFGLFFRGTKSLPEPSFVLARQPDHGYSPRGDGSDHTHLWNGQPLLETVYLTSLLPGAPELAVGLLRNYLSVQAEDGTLDCKPGMAGQRGRWLAIPLLSSLAWQIYQRIGDRSFIKEIFPPLLAFHRQWFSPAHDRDGDGFPEWEHPFQIGFDDHPTFSVWHAWGQGVDLSVVESPALAAMLCRDSILLSKMSSLLGNEIQREALELEEAALRSAVEECWDPEAGLYHYRDCDTHLSPAGKQVVLKRGIGKKDINESFSEPTRLLVQIHFKGETSPRPEIILKGWNGHNLQVEHLKRADFHWGASRAVASSRKLYTSLSQVEVRRTAPYTRIMVSTVDLTAEDDTLFLPLWGSRLNPYRARTLVSRSLLDAGRFGRPFGIPACISIPDPDAESACMGVHLPWDHLIGEGLLAFDMRNEAAQLTARLMAAVIESLKKRRAFSQTYHSETGTGFGERNAVQGLAPLGLFLETLGLQVLSPTRIRLSGKNPFPWPVTVKYRGLTVTRQSEQTVVVFPGEQTLTLNDPTNAVVSAD